MRFFSDNAAAVCPEVMEALHAANHHDTAYDGDALSQRLDAAFSDLFETKAKALWVSTGTAANSLALAALCPPYGGILCHRDAHIQNDECGAPEFYTNGAKLILGEGEGAKLSAETVRDMLERVPDGVHWIQPHALSITNATEYGLAYTPDEVAALGEIAKAKKLGFHMDGARFANAVATLGCAPAEVTWKAGVDVLSFGFVKNGGMSAEALVFFGHEAEARATLYRRKRAGHLLSKGRYMAAQILAMLKDDVWLRNARASNAGATRLAKAAGSRLIQPVEANELFLKVSQEEAAGLRGKGFDFYNWAPGEIRLVVSWDQKEADIEALAAALEAL